MNKRLLVDVLTYSGVVGGIIVYYSTNNTTLALILVLAAFTLGWFRWAIFKAMSRIQWRSHER